MNEPIDEPIEMPVVEEPGLSDGEADADEVVSDADVRDALPEDLDAHVPVLVKVSRARAEEGNLIDLKDLRHPLLVLQGEPVVPNELCLGEEKRGMIIIQL